MSVGGVSLPTRPELRPANPGPTAEWLEPPIGSQIGGGGTWMAAHEKPFRGERARTHSIAALFSNLLHQWQIMI